MFEWAIEAWPDLSVAIVIELADGETTPPYSSSASYV